MSAPTAVADVMVGALASLITDEDVTGVGLGTPLALTAALLARATHAPGSHVVAAGTFDADADVSTYLGGVAALRGRVAGHVSHFDSMDMAERQAMTLQFLRPAQVDGTGAMNTSRIGPVRTPKVRFPGGLATADVPTLLPRVVAYLPDHRQRNLPTEVSYRTGAGGGWDGPAYPTAGVTVLVTDLAVLSLGPGGAGVVSLHPGVDPETVVERTGFDVEIGADVRTTPVLGEEALSALEEIDPDRRRTDEIRLAEPVPGGAT